MCVNKYTNKKCRDVRYCGSKKLFSQCPPILYCPKTKYRWVIEKWGQVSISTNAFPPSKNRNKFSFMICFQCINGIQKRKMHCENEYGKKIRRNLCPAIKPRRKQKCKLFKYLEKNYIFQMFFVFQVQKYTKDVVISKQNRINMMMVNIY